LRTAFSALRPDDRGERPDLLSPELVLVSPELRASALAALPERPWEVFAPAPQSAPPLKPAPPPPAAAPLTLVHPPVPRERPVAGRRWLVAVALIGLFAGLAAGLLLKRPARPSFVVTRAESSPTTHTASTATTQPKPKKQRHAKRAAPRHATVPTFAIAGGGYVFGRRGHFRVSANRRFVREFDAGLRCARSIVVARIPLRRDRLFSYHADLHDRRGVPVRLDLAGRFRARSLATGIVHASSRRCDSGDVRFVARLS
jgi:hypothetical protein